MDPQVAPTMDPRAKWRVEPDGRRVATHCQLERCVNALPERPPGKPGPRQLYCCADHRSEAHASSKRVGRVVGLPTATVRHVAYGEDVLAALRALSPLVPDLQSTANVLATSVERAADLRATKVLVDDAEQRLVLREQSLLGDLAAEIQARAVAMDLAQQAQDEAELARREAAQSAAAQRLAETAARLAEQAGDAAKARFEQETARVKQTAAEAVARAERLVEENGAALTRATAEQRAELDRIKAAAEQRVRAAEERAARAEGAREAAVADAMRARDDAQTARKEVELERERGQQRWLESDKRAADELERAQQAASVERDELRAHITLLQQMLDRERQALQQSEEERRQLTARLTGGAAGGAKRRGG